MVVYLIVLVLFAGFGLAAFIGAPYVPILRRDYMPLLEVSGIRSGQTMLDLGSGDGRLMRAAAKQGIRCIGYEINPVLYLISLIVCWRYRRLVSIRLGDYWHARLPQSDVIYVFLIERFMTKLDYKLTTELKTPTTVVSFVFEVPGRQPVRTNRNTFVYQYQAGKVAARPEQSYHKQ